MIHIRDKRVKSGDALTGIVREFELTEEDIMSGGFFADVPGSGYIWCSSADQDTAKAKWKRAIRDKRVKSGDALTGSALAQICGAPGVKQTAAAFGSLLGLGLIGWNKTERCYYVR